MKPLNYFEEFLEYKEEEGVLLWKRKPAKSILIGSEAGTTRKDGYKSLSLEGKRYYVHRLVWLFHYGEWPLHTIDHIDRNPSNNHISNLRDVTLKQQQENTGAQHNSTSKYRGVSRYASGRWVAKINSVNLGSYRTEEEAALAANKYMREQKSNYLLNEVVL